MRISTLATAVALCVLTSIAGCPGGGGNGNFCQRGDNADDITSYLDGGTLTAELVPGPDSLDGCGDGPNGQQIYRFTAPEDGFYFFSTENPGTDFDTVMHLADACDLDEADLDTCNDDDDTTASTVAADLLSGETVFVAVGAYGDGLGQYELSVRSGAAPGDDDDDDDNDCISFNNPQAYLVGEAGVAVGFRVLGCSGSPLPDLSDYDGDGAPDCAGCSLRVINDETGAEFNNSSEGGAASGSGTNDDVTAYSVLALDFSFSIFDAGAAQDVVDGAMAYIQATLVDAPQPLDHQIALLAFGSPSEREFIADFTDDPEELEEALNEALAYGSRGTTDLYGSYIEAISAVEEAGSGDPGDVEERFVVILTDGTHEAGNTDALRLEARAWLALTSATVFSIGIEGDYSPDVLEELATSSETFVSVGGASELSEAFEEAAERALALARSNYVVGVCTPVALGDASLTIEVEVGSASGSLQVYYPGDELTGNFEDCDPDAVAAALGGTSAGDDDDDDAGGEVPDGDYEGQCVWSDGCSGTEIAMWVDGGESWGEIECPGIDGTWEWEEETVPGEFSFFSNDFETEATVEVTSGPSDSVLVTLTAPYLEWTITCEAHRD